MRVINWFIKEKTKDNTCIACKGRIWPWQDKRAVGFSDDLVHKDYTQA